MSGELWQLILVDALFLCLAGVLALWMRALIRAQRAELDTQIEGLAAHTRQLERLQTRLETACAQLEQGAAVADSGAARATAGEQSARSGAANGEDRYEQAWRLLDRGVSSADVARRLNLGRAEVELMGRIHRHRKRS